jgi:poly-beta-1,6-N-acetyl-D-glucosamine biosynthesis protein PgaD
MKIDRLPVELPIIRTRVPAWMQVRDVLLTLGAWLLIGYFLREGLYLAYDYFRAPIFELTTATAPDWADIWGRLRGFVLLAAALVAWIAFWALDSRARLQATHSPQPPPLRDDALATRVGLSDTELAAWRSAKVQTVDLDSAGHVIMRADGRIGHPGAAQVDILPNRRTLT